MNVCDGCQLMSFIDTVQFVATTYSQLSDEIMSLMYECGVITDEWMFVATLIHDQNTNQLLD